MKRTQEEILARIEARRAGDVLGFEWQEYVAFLSFENAKPFLNDDAKPEAWEQDEDARSVIVNYMSFAFEKAHGQRGISANRSVMHMIAWIWLNGDDDFCDEVEKIYNENYHGYGLPILRRICEFYSLDPKAYGDH